MRLPSVIFQCVLVGVGLTGGSPTLGGLCGLVDGATDGSSEPDWDADGTPDCLDLCPIVPNSVAPPDSDGDSIPDDCDCGLAIDALEDGVADGECVDDCTLREAAALAPAGCSIRVPAGTHLLANPLVLDRSIALIGFGADTTTIEYPGADYAVRAGHDAQASEIYLGALRLKHSDGGLTLPAAGKADVIVSNSRIEGEPHGSNCGVALTGTSVALRTLVASQTVLRSNVCGVRVRGGGHISSVVNTFIGRHCQITDNETEGLRAEGGGGLSVGGAIVLEDSEIRSNGSTGILVGGGSLMGFGASLSASRSVVTDNGEHGITVGGAIFGSSGGQAGLAECEISENAGIGVLVTGSSGNGTGGSVGIARSLVRSNEGGGVLVGGSNCSEPSCSSSGGNFSSTASTIIGHAGHAVALGPPGTQPETHPRATLAFTTVTANQTGFSVWDDQPSFTGKLTIHHSVVAGNTADCDGPATSAGYNFLGMASGCGFATQPGDVLGGGDPGLLPLGDHGGPTYTSPPTIDSPLVDAAANCSGTDQRGIARPFGGACDIGAVEYTEAVLFDRATYDCDDVVEVTVLDDSIAGNGAQDVSILSTSEPAGEEISLPETTPGHFTAQVALVPQLPPIADDGLVSVEDDETLTAEYLDLDDGAGGGPVVRQATAAIDCQDPVGACCKADDSCSSETELACRFAGIWQGADSSCGQCPEFPSCPPGGVAEGEPVCGYNYLDDYNSCEVAQPIAFNSTVCGESGTYYSTVLTGDSDWYEVTLSTPRTITWRVEAAFAVGASIRSGSSACPASLPILLSGEAEAFEPLTLVAPLNAGTYRLTVSADPAASPPCPAPYKARLTVGPFAMQQLTLSHSALHWVGAGPRYDVLRGDLTSLLSSGGDFTASTLECLSNNLAAQTLAFPPAPATPGEGWWFLLRQVPDTGPQNSYDSGGHGQMGTRDPEIEASPAACP